MSHYIQLAKEVAAQHNLSPALVCAVVEQESGWNPWAYNPEPHYRWMWDFKQNKPFRKLSPDEIRSEGVPPDFYSPPWAARDAEWWGQQASWGLMQVMGAVARECGFTGKFLTQLCEPSLGIDVGCTHLKRKFSQGGQDTSKALLLYNGGGNPNYPLEVLGRMGKYL